jgi:hypothetical protein
MNDFDRLRATLLDLARALQHDAIPLIIGGGFGLYLKQEHVQQSGARTLLELPLPRSTNDIDLFLRLDVLIRLDAMQKVAKALDTLGFQVLENARYFQWQRELTGGHQVKLDLLTGPLGDFRKQLKTDKAPRVRPKGDLKLHAHQTDEAIEVDSRSKSITIVGECTDGTKHSIQILLPHAFTYLIMKLFAFDDRKNDASKNVGRHHAMDLYRIVAMMTEAEYGEVMELSKAYGGDSRVKRARSIVASDFDKPTSLGLLRLREHELFADHFKTDKFIEVLAEVFAAGTA